MQPLSLNIYVSRISRGASIAVCPNNAAEDLGSCGGTMHNNSARLGAGSYVLSSSNISKHLSVHNTSRRYRHSDAIIGTLA